MEFANARHSIEVLKEKLKTLTAGSPRSTTDATTTSLQGRSAQGRNVIGLRLPRTETRIR